MFGEVNPAPAVSKSIRMVFWSFLEPPKAPKTMKIFHSGLQALTKRGRAQKYHALFNPFFVGVGFFFSSIFLRMNKCELIGRCFMRRHG